MTRETHREIDIILARMKALPRKGLINTEADSLLCEALNWLGQSELVAAYLRVKMTHE